MKNQEENRTEENGKKRDVLELEKPQYEDPSSVPEFWTKQETQDTCGNQNIPLYLWYSLAITALGIWQSWFPSS